eukprot:scaffold2048_cov224-Pinguiococcus_pyrenoidosus.AAC.5
MRPDAPRCGIQWAGAHLAPPGRILSEIGTSVEEGSFLFASAKAWPRVSEVQRRQSGEAGNREASGLDVRLPQGHWDLHVSAPIGSSMRFCRELLRRGSLHSRWGNSRGWIERSWLLWD